MPLETLQPERTKTNEVRIGYIPQPRQAEFHLSPAKYRLYIGAWRAGKSFAGCWEAIKMCMLYPGNRGLIGRKDYSDLRETTMKTFFEICPPQMISGYNKTEHVVKFFNGSEIIFRELKDRSGLGSLELGFWYIDEAEEVEKEIFQYLQGRLSKKNVPLVGWLTTNPPNEDHWLHEIFEKTKDKQYHTTHASTYENAENLPDGYIDSLEKMPPSWRKKYLEGQYGFTPDGEPFYQGYVEQVHRRDVEAEPGVCLDCGWDFGYRHPAFVVTQKQGAKWIILDEILGSDITLEKFIMDYVMPLMAEKYPGYAVRHFGDPACMQMNDKSEHTSWQIMAAHGMRMQCKPSEYRLRKEIIERLLASIDNGLPQLIVGKRCKIISDGFMGGYHYPTFKDGAAFGVKHEQPFKDGFYDHLMNAMEYIAIHLFTGAVVRHNPTPATKSAYQREQQRQKIRKTGDNI